jgi:hypothetical protein
MRGETCLRRSGLEAAWLSLLARRSVRVLGAFSVRQDVAELVLGEQLMGFQVLKGSRCFRPRRLSRRRGLSRDVGYDDAVMSPEHPVRGLNRSAYRVGQR